MDETVCDVLVAGGSLGGVAALRASLMGARVVLLAEGDWIGGQPTSQGVGTPDENPWLARDLMGGTASYLYFRQLVRDCYRAHFRLSAKGRRADPFCPTTPAARSARSSVARCTGENGYHRGGALTRKARADARAPSTVGPTLPHHD